MHAQPVNAGPTSPDHHTPAAPRPARRRKTVRRAMAVVELAVCIPVLTLVVLGSMEACNMIFLKQAITAAAYEGALVGTQPKSTESQVKTRVQTVLAARSITGATVDILTQGSSYDNLHRGEQFAVQVEAPLSANIPGPLILQIGQNVATTLTGLKQ